jgi:predicted nucleic acid-binding protein
VTVHLDSSSLVKVYVQEPGTEVVRGLLLQAATATTSVIAYAEVRAALARLRRKRGLAPRAVSSRAGSWRSEGVNSTANRGSATSQSAGLKPRGYGHDSLTAP